MLPSTLHTTSSSFLYLPALFLDALHPQNLMVPHQPLRLRVTLSNCQGFSYLSVRTCATEGQGLSYFLITLNMSSFIRDNHLHWMFIWVNHWWWNNQWTWSSAFSHPVPTRACDINLFRSSHQIIIYWLKNVKVIRKLQQDGCGVDTDTNWTKLD